ncbi:hypothetical protein DIPPA_29882 [Diplonema papillatum]|nr:hypothetical protein DIPPA_29882 [Diplonema papillatum]
MQALLLAWALATQYSLDASLTGSDLGASTWVSGELVGAQGVSDYVWLDHLSEVTKEKVTIMVVNPPPDPPAKKNKTSAVEERWVPGVDGAVGIQDSRDGTFLASYLGRATGSVKSVTHFALKLPLFSDGVFSKGSFQYDGFDSGTFHEPEWTPIAGDALDPRHERYGHATVLSVSLTADNVQKKPQWEADHPGLLTPLLSAQKNIVLPHMLYTEYAAMVKEGVPEGFAVVVNLVGCTVEIPLAALAGPGQAACVEQGARLALGAPLFRAVNVVFETDAKGHLARIGFGKKRSSVAVTEEFIAAPVRAVVGPRGQQHRFVADFGIGGPWGPVQTGFSLYLDTSSRELTLAVVGGDADPAGLALRPYVGSFLHVVLVLLVVCPVLISFVLRDARKAAAEAGSAPPTPALEAQQSAGNPLDRRACIAQPPVSNVYVLNSPRE